MASARVSAEAGTATPARPAHTVAASKRPRKFIDIRYPRARERRVLYASSAVWTKLRHLKLFSRPGYVGVSTRFRRRNRVAPQIRPAPAETRRTTRGDRHR